LINPMILKTFRETPYNLQFIFVGKYFKFQQKLTVAPVTRVNIEIKTGATQIVHFLERNVRIISSVSTVSVGYELYENSTTTTVASYPIFNVDRTSSNVSTVSIATCTFTAIGNNLEAYVIRNGQAHQRSKELILKPSTTYMISFVTAASTAQIDINYIWYESDN